MTLDPEKPDGIAMLADERRSVGVVALIAMIRMFGLFALLPVLSLYAADLRDATPLLIGLAVGAYGLTQAGFQIPLGALSDRIGRLPVIVGGLAIFAAGSVVAGMAESIYGIIAGRLLQGAGAISATLSALITDATREEVRTRSMAVFGIGIGASFMVAMVAGPLLAARFGVPFYPPMAMPELEALYYKELKKHGNEGFVYYPDQGNAMHFIHPEPEQAWEDFGPYFLN